MALTDINVDGDAAYTFSPHFVQYSNQSFRPHIITYNGVPQTMPWDGVDTSPAEVITVTTPFGDFTFNSTPGVMTPPIPNTVADGQTAVVEFIIQDATELLNHPNVKISDGAITPMDKQLRPAMNLRVTLNGPPIVLALTWDSATSTWDSGLITWDTN